MQQHNEAIEKVRIARVGLHELFFDISLEIGFSLEQIEDFETEIVQLVEHWRKQGFIEVYKVDKDRRYTRVKHMADVRGSVPHYLGLYHARVLKHENDPLVVLTFDEEERNGQMVTVASLRFMAIHNDLFGPYNDRNTKFNPDKMRAIRRKIDEYRKRGDDHNKQKAELLKKVA